MEETRNKIRRLTIGNGRFRDVMKEVSYDQLWELLNHPHSIDLKTLESVVNWCRPKIIGSTIFVDAVIESSLFTTRNEVFRKVKEGGMKWNGRQVTNVNMPIDFLEPGWAIVQLGKKHCQVLLNCNWSYE